MRHIADALGVRPSALYWHFPNKQALLAAVSERIIAPVLDTRVDTLPPRDALIALGSGLRERLLAYRDGAELVSSSLALGLAESPVRPRLAAVARRAGISADLSRIAADTVTHFVVGYVFHEQQRQQADSLGLLAPREGLTPAAAVAAHDDALGGDFRAALLMIVDGFDASTGHDSAAPPRLCEG